ncbi:MAG TPA: H-X9-DG-CTERM domain-containing protein [Chthoniobacteraceae bacterium]|nr:H-X9-DG-CTERM domain-containing protein [Chthoniobacteraceae bacterium]
MPRFLPFSRPWYDRNTRLPVDLEVRVRWAKASRSGFTTTELVVAIAVLLVLAVLIAGTLGVTRERAATIGCVQILRQYGLYVLQFATENHGVLVDNSAIPDDPPGRRLANFSNWNASLRYYYNWSINEQRQYLCPKHLSMVTHGATPTSSYSRPDWYRYGVRDASGAVAGYGYRNVHQFTNRSQVIYMGDGAALSSFGGSNDQQGIHDTGNVSNRISSYRHAGKANFWFLDGHVETLTPEEYQDYAQRLSSYLQ